MNLHNINYILQIVEAGSLIKAAEQLHVSQPCLSQLIKNIEERYKTELFVKHSKPLRLTYAGEQFIEAIRKIKHIETKLQRTMEHIADERKGRILIGIPMFRAMAFLPEVLAVYKRDYPEVEVRIHEAGSAVLERMFRSGKIDMAFASVGTYYPDAEYIPIFSEQIYIIAGKKTDLARRIPSGSTIDITEAKDESFIYVKKGHGIRGIQDKLFAIHAIKPKMFFETASIELAKQLAVACDKVTLYPEIIRTKLHIKDGGSFYTIQDAQKIRSFCICYRKDLELTGYMRAFIECACGILKEETLV